MTWHSIAADQLVWDWAYQEDGRTWELKWRLVYARAG
jgi:hypothetical protein